jgi:YD repeat-containing protein
VNARATTFSYDRSTSIYEAESPEGRRGDLLFDTRGHVTRSRPPGVVPVAFEYDARGRPVRARTGTGADERVVELRDGKNGKVEAVKNALGQERTFVHDAAGHATEGIFDGKTVKLGYDARGRIVGVTPAGKAAHAFKYSATHLLTEYAPPPVGGVSMPVRYAHDADRRLTKVTRADGTTIDYVYDSDGRVKSLSHAGTSLTYSYLPGTRQAHTVIAPSKQRTAILYDGVLPTEITASGVTPGFIGLSYDADMKLKTVSFETKEVATNKYDRDGLLLQTGAMTYTRDPMSGRVTRKSLRDLAEDFTYNAFGELESQLATYKTTELFKRVYGRDKLGRIIKIRETEQGTTRTLEYTHDASGRLSGVSENGKSVATYAYDANGNRTTATVDAQDRLMSDGGATFTHAPDGEMLSRRDASGTTVYTHTPWGLESVTLPGGGKVVYARDAAGAPVQKKVDGGVAQRLVFLFLCLACRAPLLQTLAERQPAQPCNHCGSANLAPLNRCPTCDAEDVAWLPC